MINDKPPKLITLKDHKGDTTAYLEAVYQHYFTQVVSGNLIYNGLPIKCQFRPSHNGKGFAFWHAISKGQNEDEREIDFRRCERICWIAWVIQNISLTANNSLTCWENKRGANTHVVLFFEKESYVVILEKRKKHYLFKTAYCANSQRKRQLMREREQYWESKKTEGALRTPSDALSTRGR